jgi:hypothetical protein
MKNNFFAWGLAALFCTHIACQQKTPEVAKNTVETNTLAASKNLTIPDSLAKAEMARWLGKRSAIQSSIQRCGTPGDTLFVVRGFHIPRNEMQAILDSLGKMPNRGANTVLWGMLAIKTDPKTGQLESNFIFQATDTATKNSIYFDFTRPCPTYCPETTKK